jgi:hypothetical protein
MNKREALEKCIELWTWLANHPMRNKRDWPGWGVEYALNDCFFCEYSTSLGTNECSNCIGAMGGLWAHCQDPDSPYERWSNCWYFEDKQNAAMEIVTFCKEQLKYIEREGRSINYEDYSGW